MARNSLVFLAALLGLVLTAGCGGDTADPILGTAGDLEAMMTTVSQSIQSWSEPGFS